MYILDKELINKYGDPILEKCPSGWCVPNPLWCAEHLLEWSVYLEFSERHTILTHRDTLAVLDDLSLGLLDGGWFKEIYSWSPRHKMLNPRRELSKHAWGLAIDVNWTENPIGAPSHKLPMEFVNAMKDLGFLWGGDWKPLRDWHHFELEV